MKDYKNILIIKPSSLGDVVHTLPTLKALRNRFPGARLTWVINRELSGLLEGNPYLNEIIPFERRYTGFYTFARGLSMKGFDLVIDLQGLLRSGLIGFLSGAKKRIGFANGREFSPLFYTDAVPVSTMEMHAVDRYLLIAEYLGAKTEDRDFTIDFSNEEDWLGRLIKEKAREQKILIAINPSGRWTTKRWPVEKFAALTDLINKKQGASVILIGGAGDIGLAEEVEAKVKTEVINMAGRTTLKQLAALLSKVSLLITNDSGPMHIAATLGTPVIALFGPTDPRRTGPYGKGHTIIRKGIPCSPCFKKRCHSPICMDEISVDEVFKAIEERGFI